MNRLFRYPWAILAVLAAITAVFAFQFPKMELDNNNYRFVPKDDKARLEAEAIDDEFGSQVFILVGLERPYDSIFDGEFLSRVRNFDERLQELEKIESVSSIVSTDYITSEGDSIVVEPLVPKSFTGEQAEIQQIRKRVRSWELYDRSLISKDERSTQVLVSLDISSDEAGGEESLAVLDGIRNLAHEVFTDDTKVYLAGLPVLSSNVNSAMEADLSTLIPLVVVVVLAVLIFSFRGLSAVLLPILTVVIASIWSIGAMPLFGVKLSILSTVLPVILVAVGSAYGIHVMTHYLDERGSSELSDDAHRALVLDIVYRIGKPVSLAALTTFVGFVSFCFTSVLPIREFGYFSSFGVLSSFIVAMTLIPSVLIIRGPRSSKKQTSLAGTTVNSESEDPLSGAIADSFMGIIRKKRIVVLCSIIFILFSIFSISKLVIDNVMVEYFRDGTDVVESDRFIRDQFAGTKSVSVIVRSEQPLGVLHPDVLVAMEGLSSYLTSYVPDTGKVMGFQDLIKRINQVYNADEDASGFKAIAPEPASYSDDFGFFQDDVGSFETVEVSEPEVIVEPLPPVTQQEIVSILDKASRESGQSDISGMVRELKKAINFEGEAYYEIPADPAKYGKTNKEDLALLVSNYLALLSSDTSSYANDPLEPTAIRMNVQLRTIGQIDTDVVVKKIEEYAKAKFPSDVTVSVGGMAFVERSLNRLVVQSQIVSVVISILLVFLILSVSWKSLLAGCIGIAPLAISILLNFTVMAIAGIKLNIGTALVASLAVGIGIDYTIHYLAAYNREYVASGGQGNFLRRTFVTSGKAIMINAVSVGAGFAVLVLSKFNMLAQFGFLIALTMFSSSIVALTVLPVLLTWIKPDFIKKER
ncbi:MAG: RND family transporter [Spirochaetales bacterium]|nr:RND family transporter [Spirochaetales bacterium]